MLVYVERLFEHTYGQGRRDININGGDPGIVVPAVDPRSVSLMGSIRAIVIVFSNALLKLDLPSPHRK